MSLFIVPIATAVLALLYLALTARVIVLRNTVRIALGSGGDKRLERAIRVHGNFAEYVPIALLLLAFLELRAEPAWLVGALSVMLVAGRCAHAVGVSREPEDLRFRVVGMSITLTVLGAGAAWLLAGSLL